MISIPRVQIVFNRSYRSEAVKYRAAFLFQFGIRKELSMDKHTKHTLIFFVTMLLASVVTFSILYLLPLTESGRAPPHIA